MRYRTHGGYVLNGRLARIESAFFLGGKRRFWVGDARDDECQEYFVRPGVWQGHCGEEGLFATIDEARDFLLKAGGSEEFSSLVAAEIKCARSKHKPINSAHEGYAVILEEVEEFWEEVMKKRKDRSADKMRAELVQIAAMAQRTYEDVVAAL
jgi:hypothetical protein